MKKYKITSIVGSLRRESVNLRLAKAIQKLGEDKFNNHIAQIHDLPLFNQDLELAFPESAKRLKNDIESADAILFITPEYNRGYSAAMKNAIDWASRPYGKNSFAGKPAALCGASPGAIGTACAQYALRSTLIYLGVILMGQPEVYLQFKDDVIAFDGKIKEQDTEKFLQNFVDRFYTWVERQK